MRTLSAAEVVSMRTSKPSEEPRHPMSSLRREKMLIQAWIQEGLRILLSLRDFERFSTMFCLYLLKKNWKRVSFESLSCLDCLMKDCNVEMISILFFFFFSIVSIPFVVLEKEKKDKP